MVDVVDKIFIKVNEVLDVKDKVLIKDNIEDNNEIINYYYNNILEKEVISDLENVIKDFFIISEIENIDGLIEILYEVD